MSTLTYPSFIFKKVELIMKNRFFRAALEDSESSPNPNEQAAIILQGPLADVYTQALDIALAKDGADETKAADAVTAVLESFSLKLTKGCALESAQMDSVLLQSIAQNLSAGKEVGQPTQTVYAVAQNDVTPETVVEVTKDAVDSPADDEFVLIIDATQPGDSSQNAGVPEERVELLSQAMESFVAKMGGKVYHSFKEFAQVRFGK